MSNHEGTRWRGQIPIPEHAPPLVKELIRYANDQQTTLREIGERGGLSWQTISNWRYRSVPSLDLFEAALNVLDLELCIRPRKPEPCHERSHNSHVQPVSPNGDARAVAR